MCRFDWGECSIQAIVLECTGAFNLCTDADKERLGRQAIKAIHDQMDDDKDGMIEASESRDVCSTLTSLRCLFTVQSSSLSTKNWNQRRIQLGIDASKMPIYKSPLMISGNSGRIILVGGSIPEEIDEFNYRACLFSLQLD